MKKKEVEKYTKEWVYKNLIIYSMVRVNFLKEPENNSEYFDFIEVRIPVLGHFHRDAMIENVKASKKVLDEVAVARIKRKNPFFKNPELLNFYEVSSCVLTRDDYLVYTLDLKKRLRDLL